MLESKVADALSSLDAQTAAESEKLDALKPHAAIVPVAGEDVGWR